MEMEVVIPVPATDFNFDSACSSPYMTAPSSPQRFGNFFFSAPASPTRISAFYRELNDHSLATTNSSSTNVLNAEQEQDNYKDDEEVDFEFNFSGQLERASLSADELFDGGKIRPLKPPTTGYESAPSNLSSPRPVSRSRNNSRKKDPDPDPLTRIENKQVHENIQKQRGRERIASDPSIFSSHCSRKGSRSLSPIRVSDIVDEQEDNSQAAKIITSTRSNSNTCKSYASSFLSAISFSSKGCKKWNLKDLLFRSASEGRATRADPLRKYTVLSKKETVEDVKNSSFRSTDSSGSVSRRRTASAHELHYTANRAVAEEMKRKTFLPYKQGLLGCLGFNPCGVHDISRGVGSLTRG